MSKFTNNKNISLSMAVWLMKDNYDYVNDPKYFSVTTLLKPTRMVVLERRVGTVQSDIADYAKARIGTAIHDSIERAWVEGDLPKILDSIGFPRHVSERIVVNPEELKKGDIPVYLEQRGFYKYGDYTIGGKFDFVMDGNLEDVKSTSVWSYVFGSREEDYILQGSMYRVIRPDIITKDTIKINYVFKDFSPSDAVGNPKYPESEILSQHYPLMSVEATKKFMHKKVDELAQYMNADQNDLPLCTDEELWKTKEEYAYYASTSSKRASKVFPTYTEAMQYASGKTGVVKKRGGEWKRCNYCAGASICNQYANYLRGL